MSEPELSIIVVNWNTKDLLRDCLRSIAANGNHLSYEVLVWDNNSRDASAAMVREEFPHVRLFASEENLGFGPGNNAAAKHAKGEFILLLNPDTEVRGDVLQKTLAFMKKHSDVGALGVRQVETTGVIQASCGNLPSIYVLLAQNFLSQMARLKSAKLVEGLASLFRVQIPTMGRLARYFDFHQICDTGWVMGAFTLLPRSFVEKTGLFDESFVMYGEDLDLCARVHELGGRVVFFGQGEILHHGGMSVKAIPIKSETLRYVAMIHYYRKHHPLTAWIYRLFIGGSAIVLLAKSFLASQDLKNDLWLRGRARFGAALKPSWLDFLKA